MTFQAATIVDRAGVNFFCSPADRRICTKGSLFRTLLSSLTPAYLSSLTLKRQVDTTLQPYVNSEEKGMLVGYRNGLCLSKESESRVLIQKLLIHSPVLYVNFFWGVRGGQMQFSKTQDYTRLQKVVEFQH